MGDFNIDLMTIASSSEASKFFDTIGSYSLFPNIIMPTRITSTSHTIIDNILSSAKLGSSVSENILTCISDHLAQFTTFSLTSETANTQKSQMRRDWKNFDEETFLATIQNADWDSILQIATGDPNIAMEKFLQHIEDLLNQFAPLRQFRPKKCINFVSSPWMTHEILDSMKVRDKLYKSFTCTRTLFRRPFLKIGIKPTEIE